MDIQVKKCSSCGEVKEYSCYRSRGGEMKHLLKSKCNSCLYKEHKKWAEENLDKVYEYRKKDGWTLAKRCSRRNITPDELFSKYEEQEKCCAICKKEIMISDSAIDHNHETMDFRGILCKKCNRALGMFMDSEKILKNAILYLQKFGSYSVDDLYK